MNKQIRFVVISVIVFSFFTLGNDFNLLANQNFELKDTPIYEEAKLELAEFEIDQFFTSFEGVEGRISLENVELVAPHISQAQNIKGLYISGWAAGDQRRIERLMNEVEKSDLNAVVIDLKDAAGRITFSKDFGAASQDAMIRDLQELIAEFQRRGVYTIGRQVLFKDAILAQQEEHALQYYIGEEEEIIHSEKWTDPYSDDVWNYNLEIAQQAIDLGLDELKFDYIRFPTLSQESSLTIREREEYSKSEIIIEFLKYANQELDKQDTLISADVFGLTTTIEGDLGIGQDITKMVEHLDYISPMIYPSHYSPRMYGLANPDSAPYQVIYESLADAREKLGEESYKLRPWLQDFSMQHRYGEQEVREQIEAVKDSQVSGWLLWNPRSVYTIDAVINDK
ncbi:putative glycoside hydrolase [Natroniella sulfidigena]|uniref:putative glycoside hydrolase n=1 Tax=Natroniella sulfidigena TaxID=723921 RepID=UPI00200A13A0|nr:putative glycoside hydrolase [Natroniella sulfidigena]MCK8816982.1 putative glycoside hydrolase [Natroniella sulfidigena]